MALRRHLVLSLPLLGVLAVALAPAAGAARPGATRFSVVERDFSIRAPRSVPAGDATLVIRNSGPEDHELLVVRSPSTRLPLRRDGLTVDEHALDADTAGALEPAVPGATRTLHLRLRPGRYVLFCNMTGHYLGGMHAVLVVR
jgi:uncharacterized cupredoxin-like copper-binding protein